jgi:glycosyltransferase involved in cell wall biosynthesis
MRLAWFSPMPPVRSGIASCSADLVATLGGEHEIDVFVDEPNTGARGVKSAHEFVWRHRRAPYDLTVFQLGNSSHHDFIWPYLFRYPGVAVLHDAHLHHARAAALLRTRRAADYRAEFAAAHPEASIDLAELAVAGFDSPLYYEWPMTRLVCAASRLALTHAPALAADLRAAVPGAAIESIRLGHGVRLSDDERHAARRRVTETWKLPDASVLIGVAGGLAPEKRLTQVLDAFAALRPYCPEAHLLLCGAPASHYDLAGDIRARGLEPHVTVTGYLDTDESLTDAVAAFDIALNLRWPTAREISGPWLRALAAGVATVIVDLAHLDVPSLDPRTWTVNPAGTGGEEPIAVAVDILDEDHSLRLALRRLAADPDLRQRLGRAGRRHWEREHSPAVMVEDYRRALARAAALPVPRPALPAHLVTAGDARLDALLEGMTLAADAPRWSRL